MKTKTKWIITLTVIAIPVLILLYWYSTLEFEYECFYSDDMILSGDRQNGNLVFNQLVIFLKENDANNIESEIEFSFTYNGIIEKVKDLNFEKMEKLGASKRIVVESDGYKTVDYTIRSPLGFNPPYTFSLDFDKGNPQSLFFTIQNPPDPHMQDPEKNPFSFSFGEGKNFEMPVAKKDIDKIIGKPERVEKYLKFP